jgi:transposase InsO family protein
LDNAKPGGNPVHGLTPAEETEIVAVFDEWADIDRSHRKLAHRGSWLGRFWADPSTVRRVLERRDLRFRQPKREGRSQRRPWPDWAEEKPNAIWIYDTTHWTAAGAATTVISDVISRKWIATITSADETSVEVQAVFGRALIAEGIDQLIDQANPDSVPWDPDSDDIPVLLVISDNGPQMTSGSTREFMALAWLATHYGRPGTPTDQAWIESLFGHLKAEFPHLEQIVDIDVLRAELEIRQATTTRFVSTPASDMSLPTRNIGAKAKRSEPHADKGSQKHANDGSPTIKTTNPEDPAMRTETSGICDINSDTPQFESRIRNQLLLDTIRENGSVLHSASHGTDPAKPTNSHQHASAEGFDDLSQPSAHQPAHRNPPEPDQAAPRTPQPAPDPATQPSKRHPEPISPTHVKV